MSDVKKRVRRGFLWITGPAATEAGFRIDRVDPLWLDLNSGRYCVLGQAYRSLAGWDEVLNAATATRDRWSRLRYGQPYRWLYAHGFAVTTRPGTQHWERQEECRALRARWTFVIEHWSTVTQYTPHHAPGVD